MTETFRERLMGLVRDETVATMRGEDVERVDSLINVQIAALAGTLSCFAFQDREALDHMLRETVSDLKRATRQIARQTNNAVTVIQ